MSLPTEVRASIVSINGSSCGNNSHVLRLDPNTNPPEYYGISGSYNYIRMWLVTSTTPNNWRMKIVRLGSGACFGIFTFDRDPADVDDPTGAYTIISGGTTGTAAVVVEP